MKDIKNVLVVGGGLMGKNIAYVVSSVAEYQVVIYDVRRWTYRTESARTPVSW